MKREINDQGTFLQVVLLSFLSCKERFPPAHPLLDISENQVICVKRMNERSD